MHGQNHIKFEVFHFPQHNKHSHITDRLTFCREKHSPFIEGAIRNK